MPDRTSQITHVRNPRRAATISGSMPLRDIGDILGDYACRDVTRQLDLTKCGSLPIRGGGFGDVYKGAFVNGHKVAIKCTRLYISSSEGLAHTKKSVARELYSWSKCQHKNVLELHGLAYYKNQIATVSPWMDNGTLPYYLGKHPTADVRNLCWQVSSGVAYLHDAGIAHGDIKGANVLIADDGTAKLADFGNTTLRAYSLLFTGLLEQSSLSVRWTAPEVLSGTTNVSPEADVYALGMTILEAFTRDVPFQGKGETTVLGDVMLRGQFPVRPEKYFPVGNQHADSLWEMLQMCWAREPKARVSARDIQEHLKPSTP